MNRERAAAAFEVALRSLRMALFALAASAAGGAAAQVVASGPPTCTLPSAVAQVLELPEGSGLAASRLTPGRFWSHNDSGEPVLVALDADGRVAGRLDLVGADVGDWEALTAGPCAGGSCLYVADIGDNNASRTRVTIYRVLEPADALGRITVRDVFHATYPDGPQDAEAVFVTSDGRIHVVTKGDSGPVALYRFPLAPRPGSTSILERVGAPRPMPVARGGRRSRVRGGDRVTDAALSPDGRWLALRTTRDLTFHRLADLLAGRWAEAGRVSLEPLDEPQGEGVAYAADGSIVLVGEGGGKGRPGTFARLTCVLPR